MTAPENLLPIPNFSKYAITPSGDVWRIVPAQRGRTAGKTAKVTPVIHPRGHLWSVHLWDDEGKRKRVPIKRLLEAVLGPETIS